MQENAADIAEDGPEPGHAPARAGVAPALWALVERTVEGMGYELVDLARAGHGLLRVTLDFPAPAGEPLPQAQIGIEDCERVSHQLTHLFAVEGVDYDRLEVTSPGMDRPLRGERDFTRFTGSLVMVQLQQARDGRRRLRGRLLGVEAGPPACLRIALLPPPPTAPAPRGARRGKASIPAPQVVAVELAEVEKARLAGEWEFDKVALAAAGVA